MIVSVDRDDGSSHVALFFLISNFRFRHLLVEQLPGERAEASGVAPLHVVDATGQQAQGEAQNHRHGEPKGEKLACHTLDLKRMNQVYFRCCGCTATVIFALRF